MPKCLASMVVATHMNLGTVQIKWIQALVWCIHGCQTHNQPLIAAEFDQGAKRVVMTGKRIKKERAETDATVSGLGNFKAEDFEAADGGFLTYSIRRQGASKDKTRYIIHDRVVLAVFPDVATEGMYQIRNSGEAFGEDNLEFFWMFKKYLISSPG